MNGSQPALCKCKHKCNGPGRETAWGISASAEWGGSPQNGEMQMETGKFERIPGAAFMVKSHEPSFMAQVHLDSQVDIQERNANGLPVQVKLRRGFNTLCDVQNGIIFDPKFPG